MKNKIIYFLIIIFLSFLSKNLYSQAQPWQPVRTITHGYVDVNPTFGNKSISYSMSLANWEFLAFERHSSGTVSNICLIKMDMNSQTDTLMHVTNDTYTNRNPGLCYDFNYSGTINNALVVWESNKFAKFDIFGRYYSSTTGWGNIFTIDQTVYNKSTPKCIFLSGTTFALVYTRNNIIVYKEINGQTQTITYDTTLSPSDTASVCRNPNLIFNNSNNKKVVTYEKRKSDNNYAIYYKTSSSLPVWQNADTIAYAGNNKNSVIIVYNYSGISSVFESNRGGKWNIFCTNFPNPGSISQDSVVKSNYYNLSNFNSFFFPIITDVPMTMAYSYVRKSFDSTKIIFGNFLNTNFYRDSTTTGDTSKPLKVTMNIGIKNGFSAVIWSVFNKDSLTFTNLYARKILIIIGDIKKIGSDVPDNYSLYPNYPNPFNPNTTIKFNVKEYKYVSIKIYDIQGKEAATLVDEKLMPGVYSVSFNGSGLASGAYFCRMSAGNYLSVKKMILTK